MWPNTYLSQLNISFWPKPLVRQFLRDKSTRNLVILVDGKEKIVSYKDLGVEFDIEGTMKDLEINQIGVLLSKWISSVETKTIIQPIITFNEDFDKQAIEKLPKRSLTNERVVYNKGLGQYEYWADVRKARADTVELQMKLMTFDSVKEKVIDIGMVTELSDLEKRTDEINKKIKLVHNKPLEFQVENSGKKITVNQRDILSLINIESKDFLGSVDIHVDKDKLDGLLANNGLAVKSTDWLTKNIKDNLSERFSSGVTKPVVLGIDSGPNTDGTLAIKYAEVDLSQQRMYFFENGRLFKTYVVSTGLNYPTPAGSYKIKNKLPMGYSGIFNVWMPWWMAFEYREDIGAYLGIHELPYKLVNGDKIYRFGNYIGSRKTGGCIALSPGDSKEVYDKSNPGMDLFIYQ